MLPYIVTFFLALFALEDQVVIKAPQYRGLVDKIKPFRGLMLMVGMLSSIVSIITFLKYSLVFIVHGDAFTKIIEILNLFYIVVIIALVFILSIPYLKNMIAQKPEQVRRLEKIEEKTKSLKILLGYTAIVLIILLPVLFILRRIFKI